MSTLPAARRRGGVVAAVLLVVVGAGLLVAAAFLAFGVASALAVAGVCTLTVGLLAVKVA